MPEDLARDVDEVSKSLPAGCEYQRKAVQVEYQFEPGERAEVSVISSTTVDKTSQIVMASGVDLEPYRKHMTVLWNHDQEKPIASAAWIKLYKDHLRAKTVYPDPEQSEWGTLVNDVWAMTKSGVLKMKSIGFLPRTPLREPTTEELDAHPDWQGAGIWDNSLLLEYSACSIGICNDALVQAVNTKSLDALHLKSLGVEVPAPALAPAPVEFTLEEAMAIAKGCKPLRIKKPPVNWDEVISKQIDAMSVDMKKILASSVGNYERRGRV